MSSNVICLAEDCIYNPRSGIEHCTATKPIILGFKKMVRANGRKEAPHEPILQCRTYERGKK